MIHLKRSEVLAELQADILRFQGFKPSNNASADLGLGPLVHSFPNATFPVGAIHEFVTGPPECSAVTNGFVAGILASLMGSHGTSLWISSSRKLFPPSLVSFGIQPDKIIFIDLQKEKDVCWAMDEALKCGALSAVVGEVRELSFTASRRLQLAVEQSQVTGFVLNSSQKLNATSCVSRWRVSSLPSEVVDDLPGIGTPAWRLALLRVRNGKPGVWDVQWKNGKLQPVYTVPLPFQEQQKKAG